MGLEEISKCGFLNCVSLSNYVWTYAFYRPKKEENLNLLLNKNKWKCQTNFSLESESVSINMYIIYSGYLYFIQIYYGVYWTVVTPIFRKITKRENMLWLICRNDENSVSDFIIQEWINVRTEAKFLFFIYIYI